ncbi:MAG: tryptophan synthase subunit alpha, partial [Bacteroidales bacterium]
TAGYPETGSTTGIIRDLAGAGVDLIEIGIPFSDPLADGPLIQKCSATALLNGMSLKLLFEQLGGIRNEINIPLILMGYINPVLKYGMENFCRKCAEIEVDGVILPDLPPEIYIDQYSGMFEKYNLYNILLISPRSDPERIRMIDEISNGFIYVVSSSSTTGIRNGVIGSQQSYFMRIKEMHLAKPQLIGFGISDSKSFYEACSMSAGAIIGSAFIKTLGEKGVGADTIKKFIGEIKGKC